MTTTINRREFMKLTGATVLCACAGAVGIGGCTAISNAPLAPEGSYRREEDWGILSLAEVEELEAVGGAVRVPFADGPAAGVLIVHSGEDAYHAFANRCTHNGKELDYRHEKGRVQCVSGKSHFDLQGNVIKGPAESTLRSYPVQLKGYQLVIQLA